VKIKTKKGDKCPICTRLIIFPNVWVRFHVTYNPEIQLLACKYCNYVEYALRTGKPIPFVKENPYNKFRLTRALRVVQFMGRFNIFYAKHNSNKFSS